MHWNEMEQLIILRRYDCPYCSAERGEWCKTKTGKRATWLHAKRGEELRTYSWMVYEEGEKAGKFFAERRAQRVTDELKRKVASLENLQMMWVGGA